MSSEAKQICIITPGYIASNPRTVKEADVLIAAGFKVRVVFSQGNLEEVIKHDQRLLGRKKWQYDIVKWSPLRREEWILYYKSKIRHFIARQLPCRLSKAAEHAEGRVYKELAELAALEKAAIYIGHYPAGLAAAAYAARRWGSKFSYDVEDLYSQEDIPEKRKKRISLIEKRYINKCSYISVASEMFTGWIVEKYKVDKPLVINNVFPLSEREGIDGKVKDRRGRILSLYWFSQTIGRNRGVEDAIRAVGLLKGKCQLHLRGYFAQEAKAVFLKIATKCGVEDSIFFHSPVKFNEVFSRIAEHDVGLALEQPVSVNRLLCVCNKLLSYFTGGLAIAATSTPGQKNILSQSPGSGFLYNPGDYKELARKLNEFILKPEKLTACKKYSLEAAEKIWNWEKESKKLIEKISEVLAEN